MSKHCWGCIYHDRHLGTCDYILIEGQRRGCKVGRHCYRYDPREGRNRRMGVLLIGENTSFNTPQTAKLKQRLAMYEAGLSDKEIAEQENCNPDAIRAWRKRHGLVAQKYRWRAKE